MTKEDILESKCDSRVSLSHRFGISQVYEAMKDWAILENIELLKFITQEGFTYNDIGNWERYRDGMIYDYEGVVELFIQSKSK